MLIRKKWNTKKKIRKNNIIWSYEDKFIKKLQINNTDTDINIEELRRYLYFNINDRFLSDLWKKLQKMNGDNLKKMSWDIDNSKIILKLSNYFLDTSEVNQNNILKIFSILWIVKSIDFKYLNIEFYKKISDLLSKNIFINEISFILLEIIRINNDNDHLLILYNLKIFNIFKNYILYWQNISINDIEGVLLLFFEYYFRLNLISSDFRIDNYAITNNILELYKIHDINVKLIIISYFEKKFNLFFDEENLYYLRDTLECTFENLENSKNLINLCNKLINLLQIMDSNELNLEKWIYKFKDDLNSNNFRYIYLINGISNITCIKLNIFDLIDLEKLKDEIYEYESYYEFLYFLNNNMGDFFETKKFYKFFNLDFIFSIDLEISDKLLGVKLEFIENYLVF